MFVIRRAVMIGGSCYPWRGKGRLILGRPFSSVSDSPHSGIISREAMEEESIGGVRFGVRRDEWLVVTA